MTVEPSLLRCRRLRLCAIAIALLLVLIFHPSTATAQGFGGSGYDKLKAGVDPGAPATSATGNQLELLANTVYTDSPGSMKLIYVKPRFEDKALSHGGFRSQISEWVTDGSAAVWGVVFQQAGSLSVKPHLKVSPNAQGKTIQVSLVSVTPENLRTEVDSVKFKTQKTGDNFAAQKPVSLKVPKAGFYEVRLTSETNTNNAPETYAKFRPPHRGNGSLKTVFRSGRSGQAALTVRYSIYHKGAAQVSMFVNGKPAGFLKVRGTGDMSKFADVKVPIQCRRGLNQFELRATESDRVPLTLSRLTFDAGGVRSVRDAIDCENNLTTGTLVNEDASVGDLEKAVLSGDAIAGAQVVTIRSPRTGAVHGRFGSSANPRGVVLAVMEVRIATANQPGQYFPITTPFGYFGSTWKNANGRFGGANFSMWSDGEPARAGNIEKLSRLISYRADATYTVYGHEGIGVKPIGRNPWQDMKPTEHQLLAIRKIPGKQLDTFVCYFMNFDTNEWELFGCGQKFNKSGKLTDLSVGHFMEVLYPSPHQRRESHVRGWFMNGNGDWFQVDQMRRGNYSAAKDLSHRTHGITDDGWFSMSTGGWFPTDVEAKTFNLPPKHRLNSSKRPAHLKGQMLKSILSLPVEISPNRRVNSTSNSATVQFDIEQGELTGSGLLYYGTKDCATFPHNIEDRGYPFVSKWKWPQHIEVKNVKTGRNSITLSGLEPKTKYYFRLLVHGTKYHTWSEETDSFTTK